MEKLISQGAEAHILKSKKGIIKERRSKEYRLPQIDSKLITQRTRKEAKLLQKAATIIKVPGVVNVTSDTIVMEEVKGKKLADCLDKAKDKSKIAQEIGNSLAKLHSSGIIHGDLTTSNLIQTREGVYFIDFGLGYESNHPEDKAVDLHVLKEALQARHPKIAKELFSKILKAYSASADRVVLKKLEAVELRGRYKQQY